MHKSSIAFKNNIPYISIDGELYAPFAYTAYFEERGEYADFSEKGCRMFFVNVSFSSLPINNITGFTPFLTGVFDGDTPDYKEFDETVRKILAVCPDAFIFPRINMTMPEKWINEHPSETVDTLNGGKRESLYSDVYLRDATELLFTLVDHIKKRTIHMQSPAISFAAAQLRNGFITTSQALFLKWDLKNSHGG